MSGAHNHCTKDEAVLYPLKLIFEHGNPCISRTSSQSPQSVQEPRVRHGIIPIKHKEMAGPCPLWIQPSTL